MVEQLEATSVSFTSFGTCYIGMSLQREIDWPEMKNWHWLSKKESWEFDTSRWKRLSRKCDSTPHPYKWIAIFCYKFCIWKQNDRAMEQDRMQSIPCNDGNCWRSFQTLQKKYFVIHIIGTSLYSSIFMGNKLPTEWFYHYSNASIGTWHHVWHHCWISQNSNILEHRY